MGRKVIKQGNGTLTITLPKQWTNEIGLKGGEEIEVIEAEDGLLLTTGQHSKQKTISHNVDDFERLALAKFLMACFEQGFDKITLRFTKSKIVSWSNGEQGITDLIKFFLNRLIGFEILSQTPKSVEIGNLSEKLTKFENILSRIFFLMEEYMEYLLDAMKRNDYSDLKNNEHRHDNITKLCSLGLRMVSEDNSYSRSSVANYFVILNLLDKVTDFIRYACKNTRTYNKKVSKETIKLAEKTYEHLKLFRHFFYKFDYKLINELDESRGEMKSLFIELSKKNTQPSINAQFEALVETLQGMIKPRIAMEVEKR